MNQPPRKPLRTMRRGALIALCASFAAVLAIALYLIIRPQTPAGIESHDHSTVLVSREIADIQSVTVENADGRFTCLYRDQTLVLKDDPDAALDADDVKSLLECGRKITALDTVLDTSAQAVRLSDFGLDAPDAVRVTYSDGTTAALLVGRLSPADIPSHYAMLEGDPRIYTVDPYFYEIASLTKESLRAFEQLSLKADLIDAVTVAGDTALNAAYNGEFWQMTTPYDYPMDETKTRALLENIETMRFSAYLGRADELALADYGLNSPRVALTVTQARSLVSATDEDGKSVTVEIPETVHTILIGGMRGDTMYYALYDGGVYTTGALTTAFLLSLNASDLLNRNPVSFPEKSLQSLTLSRGGEETRYDVSLVESVLPNNELETDGYGNVLYRFAVARDGREIDSEAFLSWYARLVVMQAQGWAKEEAYRDKQPSLTVTLASAAHERVIEYIPYDLTHSVCRVNGVALFYADGDLDALYADRP